MALISRTIFLAVIIVSNMISQAKAADLAEIGKWDLAVSFGAGVATNPVVGGEHIPLLIVPSIRYYDERFFFDNGAIGYTLIEKTDYAISFVNKINFNAAFFEDWSTGSFLVSALVSDGSGGFAGIWGQNDEPLSVELDIDDLATRKWSIDSGIQANWFFKEDTAFMFSYYLDSSAVHHGESAQLEATKRFAANKESQLIISVGINWQSQQVNNYYYGISKRDIAEENYHFFTNDSFNPFLKLAWSSQFAEDWRFILSAKVNYLDSSISDSPIIDESRTYLGFVGLRYDF